MVWQTIAEANGSSLEDILVYVANLQSSTGVQVFFIPMMLISLFLIVMLGTFFSQKRLFGIGNFNSSFAVAGYFVAIIAAFMSLIPGLININMVVICIAIAAIGTIMLLATRDRI